MSAKIHKLNPALDLMRTGGVLLQSHDRRGTRWFIHPHGGEIPEALARMLLQRPDIQPANDGLFGTSQTFKFLPATWQERVARNRRTLRER
jgi:hypothetical protein